MSKTSMPGALSERCCTTTAASGAPIEGVLPAGFFVKGIATSPDKEVVVVGSEAGVHAAYVLRGGNPFERVDLPFFPNAIA